MSLLSSVRAWHGLHETSDPRVDSTGNGFDLAAMGNLVGSAPGLSGTAANFPGDALLQHLSPVVASGPMSFACWLNVPYFGNQYYWFSQGSGSFPQQRLYTTNGLVTWGVAGNSPLATSVIAAGVWTHIVGTYGLDPCGNGRQRLWINGVMPVEQPCTINYSGNDRFNYGGTGRVRWARGLMQSAGIFNAELDALDVAALYNGGVPLDYPF